MSYDFSKGVRGKFRNVKLTFECAPTEKVRFLNPIAREFVANILETDLYDCLITDESRLSDFVTDENEGFYKQRALEKYGIDLTGMEHDKLVEVLTRLTPR